MRLLLDTHTFLWFIGGSGKLSGDAGTLIEDPSSERLLSVASMGRLRLSVPFPKLVEREVRGNAMEVLGIRPELLDELSKLPFHHRDPFDRLVEDAPIVGKDEAFGRYPVKRVWKMDDVPDYGQAAGSRNTGSAGAGPRRNSGLIAGCGSIGFPQPALLSTLRLSASQQNKTLTR